MKMCRIVVAWLVTLTLVAVAQTNRTDEAQDDVDWSRHVVEAYREYSEQQKLTQTAIAQAREEALATAQRTAAELEAKLKRLELTWAAQHERDIAALQESHRFTLRAIATMTALGFLALVLLVWLLLRSLNRRVETVTTALARAGLVQLPSGDNSLVPLTIVEHSNARFINAIEKLEDRIREMEQEAGGAASSEETSPPEAAPAPEPEPVVTADPAVAALLGKAQTYLNLDQFAEALSAAEEALAVDPANAEAHVKRGSALEGLDRTDDALREYDKAIALDQSLTMAYLRKGGVFNRLERYGEALECYEQALKTQHRSERPTPVEV